MPKKVDHGNRRARIADALIRVAARDGLLAVSVRHVAAEAGVSSGMVQHYFRSKDEMMTFALDAVGERVQLRLQHRAAARGHPPAPEDAVRDLLTEMLPLDEPRRQEGLVGIAFQAYAAVNPAIGAELRRQGAQLRDFVADRIRAAGTGAPDPEAGAMTLLALVEGLTLHVLVHGWPPLRARDVLDEHLVALLRPPAPGRPGS